MFLLLIILVRHWYSDELSLEFEFFFLTKFSSASWLWIYKLWLLNSMCPSFLMKCFEVCVLRFITCVVFWNYSPHDIYWSLLFVLGKDQQRAWLIIPDVFSALLTAPLKLKKSHIYVYPYMILVVPTIKFFNTTTNICTANILHSLRISSYSICQDKRWLLLSRL